MIHTFYTEYPFTLTVNQCFRYLLLLVIIFYIFWHFLSKTSKK